MAYQTRQASWACSVSKRLRRSIPADLSAFRGTHILITVAHLHVHILNSATSPLAKRRIQDFTHSWLKAYVEAQPQDATADTTWKPSNGFTRRLLLSHGRDLVRGVKLYDAKLDDGSKARLLEGGARSLRAAGQAGDKIDMSFLKPSEGNVGSQADVTDIWEGLSILLSV